MNTYRNPKVLLLGNGINRCFEDSGWSDWIDSLYKNNWNGGGIQWDDSMPMPLRAVLATKGRVDAALNAEMKDPSGNRYGRIGSSEQREMLQALLGAGFDHILTTNYSYELELAAWGDDIKLDGKLKRQQRHTPKADRADSKYNMHTYIHVPWNGIDNRVWHIHGEARKPHGTIFGQYYYAQILSRMIEYSKYTKNVYCKRQKGCQRINTYSWQDAFLLGDVYVLGFSMDYSEMDLWYLLNRKARENAEHGKVFFYEPMPTISDKKTEQKYELLKLLGVEIRDMGSQLAEDKDERNAQFPVFYHRAISHIVQEMKESSADLRKCILIPPEESKPHIAGN